MLFAEKNTNFIKNETESKMENIYTFTYQKVLLHTLFLLVFKIIESLQCIFKWFPDFPSLHLLIEILDKVALSNSV